LHEFAAECRFLPYFGINPMPYVAITANFHALCETFQHGLETRQRVKTVRGFVSGTKTARYFDYSRASVHPGGALYDAKILHTEAGHLIPLVLGGADSPDNLVPMYGEVNQGTYRALEINLSDRMKSSPKPAMLVDCSYDAMATDHRIPAYMDVYFYPDVDDLNKVVPMPLYRVSRIPNTRIEPARMPIIDGDIDLSRRLIEVKTAFKLQSWKVESVLGQIKNGQLPPVDKRPNAWIDWLIYTDRFYNTAEQVLSKVPPSKFTIGTGWPFFDPQRDFVVLCNRLTQTGVKAGECWSDQSDDPIKSALTALGTDDGIHVDHIVPEASGGWNVYSNAAVVSALYNKQKGRS
jgi:hypothetical protein